MQTMTLLNFIEHTTLMVERARLATEHALEHSARLVEREAKDEIGTYQGDIGQFAAWQELADSTKEDRVRLGFTENDPGLRSGEMRDSITHKVEMHGASGEAHIGSDDDKMLWFEMGTETQPPRSVLGGAAMRKEREVQLICGETVVAALVGSRVKVDLF